MLLPKITILTETKFLSPVYAQGCTAISLTYACSVSLMASKFPTEFLAGFPV